MEHKNTDMERMFRQHYKRMYSLARHILMDDEESRDVVSEVFARLLTDTHSLHPETEEAYLMRSVRNRCMNIVSHKSIRERVARLLTDSGETVTPDGDNDQLEQIMQIIEGLEPPIRRQILHLRHLQGLSYQAIAQELCVSKVTVYNHLSQAMDTIRKLLNGSKQ